MKITLSKAKDVSGGKKGKLKKTNRDILGKLNFKSFKVKNFVSKGQGIRKRVNPKKILLLIERKPFTSFFAVLGVLLILMVAGNVFFSPKPEAQTSAPAPKKVAVFKLGSAPQISYQGKVEKSGVIKIAAQMPGIVSAINVSEGQKVYRGTNILSLSTNYQGGNAPSLSRQITQTQYNNAKDTYDAQGDIIGKQKDLANKNNDNAEILRQITSRSASDTKALADLNKTIVDSLAQTIRNDEVSGATPQTILGEKQVLSQYQSAMVQINGSLRNLELSAAADQPPAQMAKLQHDIAVEQLDLQRKALDMNLEISRLSYNLALVNEANMFPSSPFEGTVDKIFVHVGDMVSPGTQLVSLSGSNQHVQAVVNVPENIAKNISTIEPSVLTIGKDQIEMRPSYVSQDATNGVLYSVIYQLDDSLSSKLTNSDYVEVRIPIGTADTTNAVPFIPLDSVIQTQEEAFVYIIDKNQTAKVKKITLGQIQGRYVEIVSGLPSESQVILNRNVIEGDKVSAVR
ncbi:MAG: hypothetical protein M1444_00280 [Patescibacteria group bacterium]|nr:hypothetical protein [Patescibacteria group bacterium]